ncbi:DNA-binding response regulator, NarL/FixJ family, contains REC and HTH domains [Amycolatopsis xylanica]|uniref:DNA-binding response regulator, NarL/FixJ family, contains REC and HTH domains n=1 Tax=Amycolatopsis xylanica TaxID=589385 RepID=A0A1H3CJ45_9PSEU|nr:response regulator transcription factor [Amycolatopsis xylanica]SDX54161.1 DNA-binding response regulator, NarL/FixJ family, contains REC and HTH domains [Amycolatopsis xylanica]
MIRVLIADDQALVRAGLRTMLGEPDIEVVAEAADGREAVRLARELRPDVVLADVQMPRMDGIEAATVIMAELPEAKVLILTSYDRDEYVYRALKAGASGFVLKDIEPAELVRGVRAVAEGDGMLAPGVTRRLIAEFAAAPAVLAPPLPVERLTEREREVLGLVVAGLANDEIAARLVISLATAKTHVSRILSKMDTRDRAQLVVRAYESGLVRPGSATS